MTGGRKPSPTSFGAKLGALAVGEVMFLPDEPIDPAVLRPTRLERAVHTATSRSPHTRGKRFVTARADVICHRQHWPVLKITRVE